MILRIVPLPKRKLEGTVSTMSLYFCRDEALDDVCSFGNCYDIGGLSDFYKYKIVEQVRDALIERIVYCKEDFLKLPKWWNATKDTVLLPVMSKVYPLPFRPETFIYRYLNGSQYLVDCSMSESAFTQTVLSLFDQVSDRPGMITCTPKDKALSKLVVPGSAACLNACADLYEEAFNPYNPGYGTEDEFANKYTHIINQQLNYDHDPNISRYADCVLTRDLKPYMDYRYSVEPVAIPKDPFKLDSSTIVDYDCRDFKSTLQELLAALESSVYTDVKMVFRIKDGKPQVEVSAENLYMGVSLLYSRDDFVRERKSLRDSFVIFANAFLKEVSGITAISLIKTWEEAVFITATTSNGNSKNKYVDLAALSIGSPMFVSFTG